MQKLLAQTPRPTSLLADATGQPSSVHDVTLTSGVKVEVGVVVVLVLVLVAAVVLLVTVVVGVVCVVGVVADAGVVVGVVSGTVLVGVVTGELVSVVAVEAVVVAVVLIVELGDVVGVLESHSTLQLVGHSSAMKTAATAHHPTLDHSGHSMRLSGPQRRSSAVVVRVVDCVEVADVLRVVV